MAWPLAHLILGGAARQGDGFVTASLHLPDVARFKLFVGAVLLYPARRLLGEFASWKKRRHIPTHAAGEA
jgi:hypothetical protein